MKKSKLDLDRIEVVSFETECAREDDGVAMISGTVCITRPTVYATCCTP